MRVSAGALLIYILGRILHLTHSICTLLYPLQQQSNNTKSADIMNKEDFLSELLQSKNVLPAGKGRKRCIICMEKFGKIPLEFGEAEKQIRLPCDRKHTVGTDCITKWLQDHNTCPICRYEFFQDGENEIETDEDDEDEEDEDEDNEGDEGEEEEDSSEEQEEVQLPWHGPTSSCFPHRNEGSNDGLQLLLNFCYQLCDYLGFTGPHHPTKDVADLVASRIWYTETFRERAHSRIFSIAAACVYTATHLSRQPISNSRIGYHRRSMRQVAQVAPVNKESIRAAYAMIYEERDEFLVSCERFDAKDVQTALGRLPEPV